MLYCKYGAMSMPLNIRDPRAAELAKELAARRKITMTAAIIEALQNEIKRERDPKIRDGLLDDAVVRG